MAILIIMRASTHVSTDVEVTSVSDIYMLTPSWCVTRMLFTPCVLPEHVQDNLHRNASTPLSDVGGCRVRCLIIACRKNITFVCFSQPTYLCTNLSMHVCTHVCIHVPGVGHRRADKDQLCRVYQSACSRRGAAHRGSLPWGMALFA